MISALAPLRTRAFPLEPDGVVRAMPAVCRDSRAQHDGGWHDAAPGTITCPVR